jgi:hypothetical protein
LKQWKKELSNWGRWGAERRARRAEPDHPAKRKQAAGLVKEGFSVSLASDADTEKAVDNPNPYEHRMLALGADYIGAAMHGWAHTHLDSLAHVNYDGVFYNGYKPDPEAVERTERPRKEFDHQFQGWDPHPRDLIDIPRLKGVSYLEPGTPILRRGH